MHLKENTLYDLVKVTQNLAQYPSNHMTYAHAKFEVATPNGLGVDAFTRKYTIWPWPWGKGHIKCCLVVACTSCDLCICKVWSCYIQRFRKRYNYKKHDGRTDGQGTNFDMKLIQRKSRNNKTKQWSTAAQLVWCRLGIKGLLAGGFSELCAWARLFNHCLLEHRSWHDWKIVDWDIKNQTKQTNQKFVTDFCSKLWKMFV